MTNKITFHELRFAQTLTKLIWPPSDRFRAHPRAQQDTAS